jgi:hypothetical protein
MGLYRVEIEGSGFEFSTEDGTRVRGFYVTRLAKGALEREAITTAKTNVADEWTTGRYSSLKIQPTLKISRVERLGLLGRLLARNTGYVFHPG